MLIIADQMLNDSLCCFYTYNSCLKNYFLLNLGLKDSRIMKSSPGNLIELKEIYQQSGINYLYCPILLTCQVCILNNAHLNIRSNFGSVRPVYEH